MIYGPVPSTGTSCCVPLRIRALPLTVVLANSPDFGVKSSSVYKTISTPVVHTTVSYPSIVLWRFIGWPTRWCARTAHSYRPLLTSVLRTGHALVAHRAWADGMQADIVTSLVIAGAAGIDHHRDVYPTLNKQKGGTKLGYQCMRIFTPIDVGLSR